MAGLPVAVAPGVSTAACKAAQTNKRQYSAQFPEVVRVQRANEGTAVVF